MRGSLVLVSAGFVVRFTFERVVPVRATAVSDDPLGLCELTTLNADGEEVKRVYSRPTEVEQIPEAIARELKEVTFEPTKQTVHSLMVYP